MDNNSPHSSSVFGANTPQFPHREVACSGLSFVLERCARISQRLVVMYLCMRNRAVGGLSISLFSILEKNRIALVIRK